jgi:hypothetical protein
LPVGGKELPCLKEGKNCLKEGKNCLKESKESKACLVLRRERTALSGMGNLFKRISESTKKVG